MIARLPDWQLRLEACVAERLTQPFGWGRLDCALWVGDCVRACTGHDPAAHVRGKYATAREAARLLRGFGDLADAAAAVLGPEIVPALAQPGDVGLIDNEGDPCLGVSWAPHGWRLVLAVWPLWVSSASFVLGAW